MHLLISPSTDPYLNLATEEYLLKETGENILFLYRNSPCVVVGKHQNTMAEINYRFVTEHHIPVIRRISGGGTVFHDEGNINFTFIQNGEEGNLVNFRMFITPIVRFLELSGIPAGIGPRNDILIHGLKVSGNAEHIYRKRTLHHGTLLFSSDLANLRNALLTGEGKYTDKAVKSVRSKVTNMKDYFPPETGCGQFFDSLSSYLKDHYHASQFSLSADAVEKTAGTAKTKYTGWEWNFGYSPVYTFRNKYSSPSVSLTVEFHAEKGIIQYSGVEGTCDKSLLSELNQSLIDQPHSFESLSVNPFIQKLKNLSGKTDEELFWSFF